MPRLLGVDAPQLHNQVLWGRVDKNRSLGGLLGARFGPPVMDYDKPRGAPTGGGELTEKERQALDLYVITPRALPGVMHMIDMQNKTDALTAFHEKGSVVEPFEDAMGGGPFGNQHGFTCEDLCRKQAGQLALRWLHSAPDHASGCSELRPASRPISRLGGSGRP